MSEGSFEQEMDAQYSAVERHIGSEAYAASVANNVATAKVVEEIAMFKRHVTALIETCRVVGSFLVVMTMLPVIVYLWKVLVF